MNWYLKVLKQYADFSGRARRMEYWMFALFNIIFLIVVTFVGAFLGAGFDGEEGAVTVATLFYVLYLLAMFIPSLAVLVRRLHDTGKGGGWMFISLIPFLIGPIWLLVLLFTDSEGENRFGANPKSTVGEKSAPPIGEKYIPPIGEPAPPPPQPYVEERERKTVYTNPNSEISIGRDSSCDIHVDERYDDVSRKHATVVADGTGLLLKDFSTNGSYVNGQKIHHSKCVIRQGDQIILGRNFCLSWNDINRYFPNINRSRETQRRV
jgi:uncharacterized membrane protein YhaH (DUF805 family)